MKDNDKAKIAPPENEFECARFDITDDLLRDAKVAAYMLNQQLQNKQGEVKPYNQKTFPKKAIDVMVMVGDDSVIDIFLDTDALAWDSKFAFGGKSCKLGPDQMGQFFRSEFYRGMAKYMSEKWPTSDPTYARLMDAVVKKRMLVGAPGELTEVDQPGKRVDLANKDTTGDGKRDYTSTGRKIMTFGDNGVKGGSGMYYCWPNPRYPFKWSQWKDWERIKPLCKMTFVYNGRTYMITLSPFAEGYENRGFRGADLDWDPPLSWLTPGECEQVMKLSVVRKFTKECAKRIAPYMSMSAEDVYEKINNKDKITLEEIRRTMGAIRRTVDSVLKKNQADTYCW